MIPVDSVDPSVIKAIVAGAATTRGGGTMLPDPLKIFPAAVPMRKKSQHPSVEKSEKVTKMYPVGLVIVYLQFILLT